MRLKIAVSLVRFRLWAPFCHLNALKYHDFQNASAISPTLSPTLGAC
jgi:hypothetical protein